MPAYSNPETKLFRGLARCYIASKAGGLVLPHAMDIHPVSGRCNLDCRWCIGRFQRGQIDPLPDRLRDDGLLLALQKILDPRWSDLWPSEFHFCGCDSEPLLSDGVLPAIRFLLQRDRVVELITNGLLLDAPGMESVVARIRKLSVSLDVTDDGEYRTYKFPEHGESNDGYSRVVESLRKIAAYRNEDHKSKLHISVTFVATPETYEKGKWHRCFQDLASAGVNEIRVRDDLHETFGPPVQSLKADVSEIGKTIPGVKVRFISPEDPYSEFEYCRAPRLWPALAADGCLYACAHTATSEYQPFGDLLNSPSLFELYQELFQCRRRNFLRVEAIGCQRQCPSVLGCHNEPSLAARQLGRASYA